MAGKDKPKTALSGIQRDEKGRIVKGSKPLNPAGRPVDSTTWGIKQLRKLAQTYTEDAINELAYIGLTRDFDPGTRVRALEALLNRAHGRPIQPVLHASDDPGGEGAQSPPTDPRKTARDLAVLDDIRGRINKIYLQQSTNIDPSIVDAQFEDDGDESGAESVEQIESEEQVND